MANQNLFREFTKVVGVAPSFNILKVNTGVTPEIIFAANTPPATFQIVDFIVWNNGALQAGATAQLFSTIAGAGGAAISDALAIANQLVVTRATTIAHAQALITQANNDSLYIAKNAAGDRHVARVVAYLV